MKPQYIAEPWKLPTKRLVEYIRDRLVWTSVHIDRLVDGSNVHTILTLRKVKEYTDEADRAMLSLHSRIKRKEL